MNEYKEAITWVKTLMNKKTEVKNPLKNNA